MKNIIIKSAFAAIAILTVLFFYNKSSIDVTVVNVWSSNTHDKEGLNEIFKKYNKTIGKEQGIRVNYYVDTPDNLKEKALISIKNGRNAPNICYLGLPSEYLIPINDIEGGYEIIEKFADIFPDYFSNKANEKYYSIPVGFVTQGLIYNKDMFKAANIVDENGEPTPPKTFEEFRKYAKLLTNEKRRCYGFIFPLKWESCFQSDVIAPMYNSFGCGTYDPEMGKYDYNKLAPIINTYMSMKNEGSIYPGSETIDNDTARSIFANGNIGMKFGFSFDCGVLTEQFPAKCDWGVAPYPSVNEESQYKCRMDYRYSFSITKMAEDNEKLDKVVSVWKYMVSDAFISDCFVTVGDLPYSKKFANNIHEEKLKKGSMGFLELVDESKRYNFLIKKTMSKENSDNINCDFLNVWSGKTSVDEFVRESNRISNE